MLLERLIDHSIRWLFMGYFYCDLTKSPEPARKYQTFVELRRSSKSNGTELSFLKAAD